MVALMTGSNPAYRNGKETPSLQPDSADSMCLSLRGTLFENRDSASTLAARTGSVGARHALIISAVATVVLRSRYVNSPVTSQPKAL